MEFTGIVIELIPIKEEDAMVRVLSSDGLISFFARRIMNQKNTYYASMQPFAKSHIWLIDGPQGGKKLKQSRQITYLAQQYTTLSQYAFLALISETLSQLAPTDDYQSLYELVETTLTIASNSEQAEFAAIIYLHQLLTTLGWGLQLSGCVSCDGKTDIVGVDLSLGGFVCRKHFHPTDSIALLHEQLLLLLALRKIDLTAINAKRYSHEVIDSILRLLAKHYENMTSRELRSIKLFQ